MPEQGLKPNTDTRHRRRANDRRSLIAALAATVWLVGMTASALANVVIYPSKDGTIADGLSGPCDGTADAWDWTFNQSSFEGAIARASGILDRRVVWEYDLSALTLQPPVTTTLSCTLRGAPVFPAPDATVCIYSYPVTLPLSESPDDFASEPAVFQGSLIISPYQEPTVHSIDVTTIVNNALSSGGDAVAFRFQIDPGSPDDNTQAFIDALDSMPATKPFLMIQEATPPLPGDIDGNGILDSADVTLFVSILLSGSPPDHPEYGLAADLDQSGSVDGLDIQLFLNVLLSG